MQNFVSLWSDVFEIVTDFLMSEPIIYFVGVILLICLAGFVNKFLFHASK